MKQQPKTCAYCGAEFIPERRNAMYCSSTCRQYSYLKRKTGEAPFERSHQNEIINQELKIVPPLILEESTEINETSKESMLEPVELMAGEENEVNNQSKKSNTMNYNQSNMKVSNDIPYEKLLAQEKENFNDELAQWWNHTFGEQKEKMKLISENQSARKYVQEILNLDGKEMTREYAQKFQFQMNKAINTPGKQSSDFIHGHILIGEASVQPAIFLDQLKAAGKSSMIFRMDKRIRAQLEILLRFMNGFNMRSPEFWLLD